MAISSTLGPSDSTQALFQSSTLAESAQTVAHGQAGQGAGQAHHMQSGANQSQNISESAQSTQANNLATTTAMMETAREGSFMGTLMDLTQQELAVAKKAGGVVANSV